MKNEKCFAVHERVNVECDKLSCRYWIDHMEDLNCTIIAANKGEKTLEEVGSILGYTRMRICQIEKESKEKLKKHRDYFGY